MHGPQLSYDERVAMLAGDVIRLGSDANLSNSEVMLLKALLDRRNGNVAAFAEETEKGWRLTKIGAELFGNLLEVAGKLPRVFPESVFWALHKAVIMVPAECVVVRPSIEDPQEVLLARRPPNDPFFQGDEKEGWHSPGVIMGVGERDSDAIARCADRETQCSVKCVIPAPSLNHPNFRRGHERSQIWVVELTENPSAEMMEKHRLAWFRRSWNETNGYPMNLLRCHIPLHKKVGQFLDFYLNRLPKELRTEFLQAIWPAESLEP